MATSFRYAMCNEAFEGRPFGTGCRDIKSAGYDGIEIAPHTLAADPLDLNTARRRELRDLILDEGLDFVGLHWILVGPQTLHVTTPDAALRDRSWQYVRNLVELCSDLGPAGVLVFGSPRQRSATGGSTPEEAKRRFVEGLANLAPYAEERAVTVLVEALPYSQSNVVHTLDEAAAVVREINSPAVRTMFDCHNAEDETEPHSALIEKNFDLIRHVHVNEMDGRRPGTGDYDFRSLFRTLDRLGYHGWISLEIFDFQPDADTVAVESLKYLKSQAEIAFAA
jgi:D-psicose/D-tagatose/L-ribulose 3-epimerase